MKIIQLTQENYAQVASEAKAVLGSGGLVIFPTETTYGAGVDATNNEAVQKLLRYKSKREGKPLSIAVTDKSMAEQYVELNESAKKTYARFLPGPVTVVSKGKGNVAEGVESEFGTLGVRIPDYPFVLQLLKELQKPITATSANASGKKRPYTIQDIFDNISEKQKQLIDLVIDAGTLPPNEPSTVIDTTLSTPIVLRPGSAATSFTKSSTNTLTSNSESETQTIAGKLLLKHWETVKSSGLLIALDGPLGAGKTVFTKGLATFLNIHEEITSPTYSYIEEYDWTRHGQTGKLIHIDAWKIDTQNQLQLLKLDSLVKDHSVIVIEWWNNIESLESLLSPNLHVELSEKDRATRLVSISEL